MALTDGIFTVIAGDFKEGRWVLEKKGKARYLGGYAAAIFDLNKGQPSVDFNDASVQEIGEEDVRKLGRGAAGAVIGGIALGPVGLIGGALLGSLLKKKEICFSCAQNDGKKFLAVTNVKTWHQILGITGAY